MGDKKYMVLAFLGLIIICVVYATNVDTSKFDKVFGVDNFYTPIDVGLQQYNSSELVKELTGSRQVTCPQTVLERSNKGLISMGNYYRGTGKENRYNITYFFIPAVFLDRTPSAFSDSDYDLVKALNLKNTISGSREGLSIENMINSSPTYPIEIIAPFNFHFLTTNTVENNKISIISYDNNCKITFDGVDNWFCAGPIGEQTQIAEGTGQDYSSWFNHTHNSIMGSTPNAVVSSGSAGDIIGYVNNGTVVTIEVLNGNKYDKITVEEWLSGM